jgi:hypothetical protein
MSEKCVCQLTMVTMADVMTMVTMADVMPMAVCVCVCMYIYIYIISVVKMMSINLLKQFKS